MTKLTQISLKSVLALQNGKISETKGNNLLSFNFIYPKAGLVAVESIKKIPLESDVRISFEDQPFSEKIIFKDYLEGDSTLKIILTSNQTDTKIKKVINDAIKTGVLAGISFISGGIAISIFTAIGKTIIESVFDRKNGSEKSIVIGMIEFPINGIGSGDYTFNLSTIEEIKLKETIYQNGEQVIKTRTIPKGIGIAQIILEFKIFENNLDSNYDV